MDRLFPPNQLWSGGLRNGMVVLLVISTLVCIYTVLTIASLGYAVTHPFISSSKLSSKEYEEGSSGIAWGNSNYNGSDAYVRFYVILASCLLCIQPLSCPINHTILKRMHKLTIYGHFEIMIRLLFVPVELFHLPISFYLYRSDRHHPVAALVMSILLLGTWTTVAVFRAFLDFMFHEIPLTSTWLSLSYTSVAFASFTTLAYIVYLGYAAAAVHAWRREKKERERMRRLSWRIGNGGDGNEIELERKG
ncbi:hypothetical protein P152DRAFT_461785 [Eremomyces bilateralis CBS 781.70]|uniref:Uncharacterized protein n=1 Tax=Eremomyces bilateralis CBS 781.70 TaxID=1392243 RepID=A0A6G1FTS3_9PEZI|nr:uncharacterized protein P152DRAFT_461785 [Eremomyces bilateralis CBS 781.70]KAF1809140.1 hypothetical protein P152DRAFT_461785 [Eremomyces bilateralis CBS 781.70]